MLHEEYGVKAVVNCIGEYIGPVDAYDKYDIEQLWIPVADYAAVSLMKEVGMGHNLTTICYTCTADVS